MKNKKKNIKIILVLIFIIFFVVFYIKNKPTPKNLNIPKQPEIITSPFEAIDGEKVSKEIFQSRPIAIMIENHPDTRPQSGLSEANVVYETLAEGGITRFLALFQTVESEKIGPVRSAREYFAQIADEWGALYAHVGGSNQVIGQLKKGEYKNLLDVNEYYNGELFKRLSWKLPPHNVFTSVKNLKQFKDYASTTPSFEPWKFKNDSPAASSSASTISIDFSRTGYEVGWKYNQHDNSYARSIYFAPDVDAATKRQITAKAVVVQMVKVTEVPKDPLLHVDIDLSSGGQSIIFQDGVVIEGSWKKINNRTRFYDSTGNEINFNRGPIWMELVPEGKTVEWR